MSQPPAPRDFQRIAKLLARAGIASRREIERMIEERRIAINGEPVETPATLLSSLHGVTVDGQPVKAPAPTRLFRYHKPTGLITAASDPKGRPTIYDRLPKDLPRLMPVGRLDMNTEGLLLLTSDGEFKRQLELPSTGVERSYRARVFGDVSQAQLEELIHGIEIEGVRYGAIDANLERRTGRNGWVEMKLTEGKNREVRRVLEFLGLQVSRLIRTAYGPFVLGDLPPGEIDEVRQHDLVAFRKELAGGPKAQIAQPRQRRAASEAPPRPRRPSAPTRGSATTAPPRARRVATEREPVRTRAEGEPGRTRTERAPAQPRAERESIRARTERDPGRGRTEREPGRSPSDREPIRERRNPSETPRGAPRGRRDFAVREPSAPRAAPRGASRTSPRETLREAPRGGPRGRRDPSGPVPAGPRGAPKGPPRGGPRSGPRGGKS